MAKNLKIKAAWAAKDMAQKDLADAMGVARQMMNAIEKGDYNPSINLCIANCNNKEI
ncbi:helix-turn-helix protein [Oxobacter pfennigii]|uniref:Helix-turn-helix protein n=1 Tax=Oxobacter pfennigii TaxID=36849 RepID=A0A0P8X0L9_9CLOT|nr:helix-turn-helix domain-containing protein [Oxobacter pfennigii]KPU44310.1 helix-turn-helix protein [Oxobacter pfennigii]